MLVVHAPFAGDGFLRRGLKRELCRRAEVLGGRIVHEIDRRPLADRLFGFLGGRCSQHGASRRQQVRR
jgi:hypothetical protein